MNKQYQTLILGGGLSGLTVAHKLQLHNPNQRFASWKKGAIQVASYERIMIKDISPK